MSQIKRWTGFFFLWEFVNASSALNVPLQTIDRGSSGGVIPHILRRLCFWFLCLTAFQSWIRKKSSGLMSKIDLKNCEQSLSGRAFKSFVAIKLTLKALKQGLTSCSPPTARRSLCPALELSNCTRYHRHKSDARLMHSSKHFLEAACALLHHWFEVLHAPQWMNLRGI